MSSRLTTLCRQLPPSSHSLHPALHLSADAHLGVSPRSSAYVCKGQCQPGPGTASAYSRRTWSSSGDQADSDQCRSETHWECKWESQTARQYENGL